MIKVSPLVKNTYPKAKFGVMAVGGLHSASDRSVMDQIVTTEIEKIKSKHSDYQRQIALTAEPLFCYADYYKRYKKSYPVLGQLESVLLKGKSIPPAGAPIEAMLLAEITSLLLTAGHDLDLIKGALTVDVAAEPIGYKGISKKELRLVNGDIYLADEQNILSSILNGPDYHTRITESTQNALYFVYGVEGVAEPLILTHLNTIFSYLSQAVQGAKLKSIKIL